MVSLQHWIAPELELGADDYRRLVDEAIALKSTPRGDWKRTLAGKQIFQMFFNQSLRTRSSFQVGIDLMGGHCVPLDPGNGIYTPSLPGDDVPYSTERVADVARVLSQFGDALMIRMYGEPAAWVYGRAHETLKEFAAWSGIPVVSMECDRLHPCQGLADLITIKERLGTFKRRRIVVSWAYSGSWHKPVAVPQSALLGAAKMGMDVVLAHPEGFELDPEIVARAERFARSEGGSLTLSNDMAEAFRDADVVYPKSWCSLDCLPRVPGDPVDEERMGALFERNRHWICDAAAMAHAKPSAFYMHCLPCDRGQEVTDDVVDGPQSAVFQQAANRLYAQCAVMNALLGGR